MINILIIEDNDSISSQLENLLHYFKSTTLSYIGTIDIAPTYDIAYKHLRNDFETDYQLIFWDINLNGKKSFGLSPLFPPNALLVFFTSHESYYKDLLNLPKFKSEYCTMDVDQKASLENIEFLFDNGLVSSVIKSDLHNTNVQSAISNLVYRANNNYGEIVTFNLQNNKQKGFSLNSICCIMIFNESYFSIHPQMDMNEDDKATDGRLIIVTNHEMFVTNKNPKNAKLRKTILTRTDTSFIKINNVCSVNVFQIFDKIESGKETWLVLDCIESIPDTEFFDERKGHMYKQFTVSMRNTFNRIHVSSDFEDKFKKFFLEKRSNFRKNG